MSTKAPPGPPECSGAEDGPSKLSEFVTGLQLWREQNFGQGPFFSRGLFLRRHWAVDQQQAAVSAAGGNACLHPVAGPGWCLPASPHTAKSNIVSGSVELTVQWVFTAFLKFLCLDLEKSPFILSLVALSPLCLIPAYPSFLSPTDWGDNYDHSCCCLGQLWGIFQHEQSVLLAQRSVPSGSAS